jgi:hypothetical protein
MGNKLSKKSSSGLEKKIVADYLKNSESERKIVTNKIFESWNYFKIEMRKILDDSIRKKITTGEIRRLK